MRIKTLYPQEKIIVNHKILKITDNSKDVIENSIFVAIKGYQNDGMKYIEEAIRLGAKTIICENDYPTTNHVNVIKVSNSKKELALILKRCYRGSLKNFKLIGITGTNGKTTCVSLLYKYLRSLKKNVIAFSSNGNYINDQVYHTKNTTPNIITIYELINKASFKKGFIVIEISSQALRESRVLGFDFDICCITNLSQDHLDYHHSLSDYTFSKGLLLFQAKKTGIILLNHELKAFRFFDNLSLTKVISYGGDNDQCKVRLNRSSLEKTEFYLFDGPKKMNLTTTLIGEFNIQNFLTVYNILKVLKIDLQNFGNFTESIERVKGRMNVYTFFKRTIIIDYAHTPKAVEESLRSLSKIKNSTIRLVIGCGGNRDRLKRPVIGRLACEYADYVYFTEDNSRNETTLKIINEMVCDLTTFNYIIIEKRYDAIRKAVMDSKEGDILVLMGKGIEKTYSANYPDGCDDLEMILTIFKEVKYA